jgi:hypothetical protein
MPHSMQGNHKEELKRLKKAAALAKKFSLFIAEFDFYIYRDRLIEEIDKEFKKSTVLEIEKEKFSDFTGFEAYLSKLSRHAAVIHLTSQKGLPYKDKWPGFFKGLNYHREKIARENPVVLIIWMLPGDIREFTANAADMWHWRAGVFSFAFPGLQMITAAAEENIQPRIRELLDYLKNHAKLENGEKAPMYYELAESYFKLADFKEAKYYSLKTLEIAKDEWDSQKKQLVYKLLRAISTATGEK